jgi:heptosyltransferase-1
VPLAESPRIALVKLSALGDVVHALPVAASLKAARPRAQLAWIVERREAAVLRDHPAVDEVIMADTRGWRRARRPEAVWAAVAEARALRRRLADWRFDVVLDLQGLMKSGLVAAACGAPVRIGFAASWGREPLHALFVNRRVQPPEARHVVEQYLALLAPLGVAERRLEFRLPAAPAVEARMEEWLATAGLKPHRRLVVLNPGAGRADKRWPVEHFAALARGIAHEAEGHVLVTWGPGEAGPARAIVDAAPGAVLAPATDLDALLALLRRASVVVAADTGPLHLAAALGTPCVGLYGPTSAGRNGPYGEAHRALAAPDGVMASLGVEPVFQAVAEILAR